MNCKAPAYDSPSSGNNKKAKNRRKKAFLFSYLIKTLLEKFWRISLSLTDDANAKLHVTKRLVK